MSDDEGFDLDDEVVYQGRKATVLDVGDEIMIEMLDDGDVLEVDPTELHHFEPEESNLVESPLPPSKLIGAPPKMEMQETGGGVLHSDQEELEEFFEQSEEDEPEFYPGSKMKSQKLASRAPGGGAKEVRKKYWTVDDQKALFKAARLGDMKSLITMVEKGAPVNCTPYGENSTPAYIAASNGQLDVIEFLAKNGADLNKKNDMGYTPSHAASQEGHEECLKFLANFGADIDLKTKDGESCLDLAKRYCRNFCIEFLETFYASRDHWSSDIKSQNKQCVRCQGNLKLVTDLNGLIPDHICYRNDDGYSCAMCEESSPTWPMWHCSNCLYDACTNCIPNEIVVTAAFNTGVSGFVPAEVYNPQLRLALMKELKPQKISPKRKEETKRVTDNFFSSAHSPDLFFEASRAMNRMRYQPRAMDRFHATRERVVQKRFICFPHETDDMECTNKMYLHESVLSELTRNNVEAPYLFRIEIEETVEQKVAKVQEVEEYTKRITELYTKYAPDSLGHVDAVIEKNQHQLHLFYGILTEKYHVPAEEILPPFLPQQQDSEHTDILTPPKMIRAKTLELPQIRQSSLIVGVQEFGGDSADMCIGPRWVMNSIGALDPLNGQAVLVTSISNVPVATFARFVALEPGLLAIMSDVGQEAFLEEVLSSHVALTKGQIIRLKWLGKFWTLFVKDLQPKNECRLIGDGGIIEMTADVEPFDPEANIYDIAEVEDIRENEEMPMDFDEQERLAETLREEIQLAREAQEQILQVAQAKMTEKASSMTPAPEMVDKVSDEPEVGPNEYLCSICNRVIPKSSQMLHDVQCARNFVKCKVCGEGLQRRELKNHMEQNHDEVTCECGNISIGKIRLNLHKKHECMLRIVSCKYCLEDMPANELPQHEEECGEIEDVCYDCSVPYKRKNRNTHVCTKQCNFCGARVEIDCLLLHKISDCPQRRAQCKFCRIPYLVSELKEHEEYCGSKTFTCEKCGKVVMLKHAQAHEASNCEEYTLEKVNSMRDSERRNPEISGIRLNLNRQIQEEELDSPTATTPEMPENWEPFDEITVCETCGKKVLVKDYFRHLQMRCSNYGTITRAQEKKYVIERSKAEAAAALEEAQQREMLQSMKATSCSQCSETMNLCFEKEQMASLDIHAWRCDSCGERDKLPIQVCLHCDSYQCTTCLPPASAEDKEEGAVMLKNVLEDILDELS